MPELQGPRVDIGGGYSIQFRTAPRLHGILGEWEPDRPPYIYGKLARRYRAARSAFMADLAKKWDANLGFLDIRTGEQELHQPPATGDS